MARRRASSLVEPMRSYSRTSNAIMRRSIQAGAGRIRGALGTCVTSDVSLQRFRPAWISGHAPGLGAEELSPHASAPAGTPAPTDRNRAARGAAQPRSDAFVTAGHTPAPPPKELKAHSGTAKRSGNPMRPVAFLARASVHRAEMDADSQSLSRMRSRTAPTRTRKDATPAPDAACRMRGVTAAVFPGRQPPGATGCRWRVRARLRGPRRRRKEAV